MPGFVYATQIGLVIIAEKNEKITQIMRLPHHSPSQQQKIIAQAAQAWPTGDGWQETPLLQETSRQLRAYLSGHLRQFNLPLEPKGTIFQQHVWQALSQIPYGDTVSYGWVAAQIGKPGAYRAVGGANHRNPIPIVIPCHRVIGIKGHLVGYGGGLPLKKFLLDLEAKFK